MHLARNLGRMNDREAICAGFVHLARAGARADTEMGGLLDEMDELGPTGGRLIRLAPNPAETAAAAATSTAVVVGGGGDLRRYPAQTTGAR